MDINLISQEVSLMKRYFTIGIAGHIDHGKTSLTKVLTGIDTDRLKEEKERNISIEPGFALLFQEKDLEVAIVDVPGHENFIRQMIAGVAGIDLVIIVIAADEGIMPQTKEHVDILSLLGMDNGIVVVTKVDQADEELRHIVVDDIKETMEHTFLESAPIYYVDSLSKRGISDLHSALKQKIQTMAKRETSRSFRLPIDQVFTVKGQGVVVRGTIYNGEVSVGDHLKVLPQNEEVRVRQIQRHHKIESIASEGQRAAINLGGIAHQHVARGDVLVCDDTFSVSKRIDVVLYPLADVKYKVKQRQLVKLHIGTAEVMGKVIFFDRNEMNEKATEEVYCQLELEDKIVVTRGDRFIVRRATPVETIGGGWVIEPKAEKHRFGERTVEQLRQKKEGTAKERILLRLEEDIVITKADLMKDTSIIEHDVAEVNRYLFEIEQDVFTAQFIISRIKSKIIDKLNSFHEESPMRSGINKAEIVSVLNKDYPLSVIEFTFETLRKEKEIKTENQYVSIYDQVPTLPAEWQTAFARVEKELIMQGVDVEKWDELLKKQTIPAHLQTEYYYYLLETGRAYLLEENRLVTKSIVDDLIRKLQEGTELAEFTLQDAREILNLTRKNLVPLLELFDRLGFTKRKENRRIWIEKID